jgi:hypothetical protein
MNLAFQPDASREDLGDFFYLHLFRRWTSARNRMTGIVDGVPVDMLDCTFSGQYGRVTVVLLPAPGSDLPPFDLRRRGFFARLSCEGLVGDPDTTIKPYKGQPPRVRKCHERFWLQYNLRRYYLSDHFEEAAAWAALKGRYDADNGLDPDRAGMKPEIQRFFNLDLLHFFADHPGWCIESDGAHLALWRPNKTIRAVQRPPFVAEALEVYRALARAEDAWRHPGPSGLDAGIGRNSQNIIEGRVGFSLS